MEECYVPVPQVNSVSISICLMMFPQMQTVVHYLTKCTPPCSLQISLPIISHNNPSPSLPFTLACLMSMHFVTTPLYHMDSACSEQPCMELLPRWLISPYVCFTLPHVCFTLPHVCFTLPHVCFTYHMGTSVLLFFYLMSLVPLVTYLFHVLLFKHRVLVCLSQFEIST